MQKPLFVQEVNCVIKSNNYRQYGKKSHLSLSVVSRNFPPLSVKDVKKMLKFFALKKYQDFKRQIMNHGGKRDKAGRKKGSTNLLTSELRQKINAEDCIAFLQALTNGRIKGATIGERKDAAIALLKKVLPDCKQIDASINSQREKCGVIILPAREIEEMREASKL